MEGRAGGPGRGSDLPEVTQHIRGRPQTRTPDPGVLSLHGEAHETTSDGLREQTALLKAWDGAHVLTHHRHAPLWTTRQTEVQRRERAAPLPPTQVTQRDWDCAGQNPGPSLAVQMPPASPCGPFSVSRTAGRGRREAACRERRSNGWALSSRHPCDTKKAPSSEDVSP